MEKSVNCEGTNNKDLMIENAYWGEGSWYLNTWLPNQHENPNKSGTIIGRKVDITVISKTADILENTYLTTIQIWMYLVLQGKERDEQDRLVGGGHHPQQAIISVKETTMEYEKKELAI